MKKGMMWPNTSSLHQAIFSLIFMREQHSKPKRKTSDSGFFCTNLLNEGYYNQLSLVKYINVKDMGRNIGVQMSMPLLFKK
jgi:hypothetical protein